MATIICTTETINALRSIINASRPRSTWSRGVNAYALEILDSFEERIDYELNNYGELLETPLTEELALNGASDWAEFSEGGCSLCYNSDIAERLLTKSERARYFKSHNINLIRCQTVALVQAWRVIVVACSDLA